MDQTFEEQKSVLSTTLSSGPHGLGDPNDRTLRKVEVEVLIPKLMREKARKEKCINEVEEFNKCCMKTSLLMVLKCQDENTLMKDCLVRWYNDKAFRNECTEEYLNKRSEFRKTGQQKSIRRM